MGLEESVDGDGFSCASEFDGVVSLTIVVAALFTPIAFEGAFWESRFLEEFSFSIFGDGQLFFVEKVFGRGSKIFKAYDKDRYGDQCGNKGYECRDHSEYDAYYFKEQWGI